jgi:peptidoglycan/LPS O-acetylase OafA/YrhL
MSDRARHIPTLDGLRAVAILMVIASHAHLSEAGWYPVVADGYVGVLIFFALSGFLITTHLIWEYDSLGRVSLRDFYIRRAFRILPPALLYLAALAALARAGLIVCGWPSIRAALLFYANYVEHDWAVSHFWSLSVEEHFYFLWPALLIAGTVRRGWLTALALAIAVVGLRFCVDHLEILGRLFGDRAHGNYHTDLVFDALLWGCCLAFGLRRYRPAVNAAAATLVALTAMCLLLVPLGPSRATFVRDLLPAVLLGSVVAAPRAPIGRILDSRLMSFIGRLSYSLYLWQQLFLTSPDWHWPILASLSALFACAYVSYRWVERPAIRFGRKLLRRETAQIATRADPEAA